MQFVIVKNVIYICNKCDTFHSNLFQHHTSFKINQEFNDIFTGYCKEEKHKNELEFFCITHNQLCCAECITKIKGKGKGQHKDCDVCFIEDIKQSKKNNLKKNIESLQTLSNNLLDNINRLKDVFEKINESKENLKIKIQKIFTTIRNALNEREDKLLLQVDNKFNKVYFNENIILESQKLPNKIKIALERGIKMDEEWNDDKKLCSLINDCINIENNIKDINNINDSMKKCNNSFNIKISFIPEKEEEITKIVNSFYEFGHIYSEEDLFYDSLILNNNKNYIDNILKWINKNNIIRTELLYRKSKDGDSIDTFHKLCDNKENNLILIKTTDGILIGGYTPLSWDDHSGYKHDNNTFIFSLTTNNISKKKQKNQSIYCHKNCGPCSCCFGLGFKDKRNMSQGHFDSSCSYYTDFSKIIPNNKAGAFDVEEVEIFQILFY